MLSVLIGDRVRDVTGLYKVEGIDYGPSGAVYGTLNKLVQMHRREMAAYALLDVTYFLRLALDQFL